MALGPRPAAGEAVRGSCVGPRPRAAPAGGRGAAGRYPGPGTENGGDVRSPHLEPTFGLRNAGDTCTNPVGGF